MATERNDNNSGGAADSPECGGWASANHISMEWGLLLFRGKSGHREAALFTEFGTHR
jgi:hypothetical protein